MFITRLFSGIVLVLIALVTLITGGGLLAAILLFISLVAFHELCRAMRAREEHKKIDGLEITGIVCIAAYYIVLYFSADKSIAVMTLTAGIMAFLFVYVIRFPRFHANQVAASVFSYIYAPVMLSFIFLTRDLHYGKYIVWLILISSWGCDTCAYVVGMAFGKTIGNHKIFPKLSPKKSLEGCIGGVAGAVAIGALFGYFFVETVVTEQEVTWVFAVICGVGAVFSQMGDLAASAIKRNHDIKDYGKLIPGHGGIMDRFDSVIVTAPMIYFLARLLMSAALIQ